MSRLALRTPCLVWLALVALLAATVGSALLPLGMWNAVVNFGIASIKAALVLVFFMHLPQSTRTVWVVAAAGVFWLALLFGLSLADLLWQR